MFSRPDFAAFLNIVAGNAARRAIGHTYLMTSDVAWQMPDCAPNENIRLWWDQSNVAAYAWFQPPDELKFDVRSDLGSDPKILAEILEWAEQRRSAFPPNNPFYIPLDSMDEWVEVIRNPLPAPSPDDRYLVTTALESDRERIEILEQTGFGTTRHFEPILTCNLAEVETSQAPTGFTLRHVKEGDFEERVALHAAAWAPASGFNMDLYLKVRAITEVFDPDLDIVAVANDGTFASYTIAWIDSLSRIGSFEPFGTHPSYRGTGVSKAVIHEGFRRLLRKGMQHARIYTAGFNHQAAKLYRGCGFEQIDVNRTMIKRL
ncbi:MAG: GNAT family N-acetyltransferase [Pseudomonadales bacterium]